MKNKALAKAANDDAQFNNSDGFLDGFNDILCCGLHAMWQVSFVWVSLLKLEVGSLFPKRCGCGPCKRPRNNNGAACTSKSNPVTNIILFYLFISCCARLYIGTWLTQAAIVDKMTLHQMIGKATRAQEGNLGEGACSRTTYTCTYV